MTITTMSDVSRNVRMSMQLTGMYM